MVVILEKRALSSGKLQVKLENNCVLNKYIFKNFGPLKIQLLFSVLLTVIRYKLQLYEFNLFNPGGDMTNFY